jgi:hypothetical protein
MTTTPALYIALELRCDKWLLACTTQAAQGARFRALTAWDLAKLQEEITNAMARFQLPALSRCRGGSGVPTQTPRARGLRSPQEG